MIEQDNGTLKLWTSLVKEVGLPGAIILLLFFIFFFVFTAEQKETFIDSFILFRNYGETPMFCILTIIALIITLIIISVFYSKDMKVKKAENNRIGIEKTELMQKLFDKKLSSSD